jgi:predicted ribonuclease YlaK
MSSKKPTVRNKKTPKTTTFSHNNLTLSHIDPLTANQQKAFEAFFQNQNLILTGVAGTGKTFIAMYLAFNEVFNNFKKGARKVIVVRSAVPTRDIGFLPGTEQEKMAVYITPYKAMINQLFGRGDCLDIIKQKSMFEVLSTSFIRGTTIDNAVIIVDEVQNLTFHELDSIITRVGENTRIIFCGDIVQTDLNKSKYDTSGLLKFQQILRKMSHFEEIEFTLDDIVRSGLVKEYLITKHGLNV